MLTLQTFFVAETHAQQDRRICISLNLFICYYLLNNLFIFVPPGHNTDGKYFVSSNKMEYKCEMVPRKLAVFIEKSRDGHVTPITDVDVREIACGNNHTVSGAFFSSSCRSLR
jgi:hypothetical protein